MADKPDLRYQPSTTALWIGLISAFLILVCLSEAACLGILYLDDSLKGRDTRGFAQTHLITRLFVSKPPNPITGKNFVGTIRWEGWLWAQWLVADGLLGWRLEPDNSAVYDQHPNSVYLFMTDGDGFITDVDDPPVMLPKPPDVYRVIVLGGSTVMGEGAPRPSQNLVAMLRNGVRDRGLRGPQGKRVELINAGVDSYNSAQEYMYLTSDLVRFKPDLVIVYDGWNDSVFDFNKSLSPYRDRFYGDNQKRLTMSFSVGGAALLEAQNIVNFLTSSNFKLAMIEVPWRLVKKLPSRPEVTHTSSPAFDPRNVEFYERNRRAFLALADDQLSVALFLQPLVGTDDRALSDEEKASWWYPKLDEALGSRVQFYDRARHILADLKATDPDNARHCVADLSHSLKGVSEAVYADSGHLLPKGNEVVAARMLDQLVECNLLR
jgi:hypothetical protein